MKSVRTLACVSFAAALAMSVTPNAAAATHRVVRVTPTGASLVNDQVRPLTGTANEVVFKQMIVPTDDFNINSGSALIVRFKDGHEQVLGPATEESRVSAVGDVVTAAYTNDSGATTSGNVVDVWSASSGHRHQVTLTAGDVYVSAGPHGFVYITRSGVVKLRTLSGHVTALGKPFASSSVDRTSGAASARGVVVSNNHKVAYLPFASPGTVTPLTVPAALGQRFPICNSVSSDYTACDFVDFLDSDDFDRVGVAFLPLDGSTPTSPDVTPGCPDVEDPWTAAVAGDALFYTCANHLFSGSPGDTTFTESTQGTFEDLASAFGKGVIDSSNQEQLLVASSASDIELLRQAKPSPVTADRFSLSKSRIVYADDQPGGHPVAVVSRNVSTRGTRLNLGAAHVIANQSGVLSGTVEADATATVYAVNDPTPPEPQYPDVTLTIHVPGHTRRLDASSVYGLSGKWLAYYPPGRITRNTLSFYNVLSGQSHTISTAVYNMGDSFPALSANDLYYSSSAGIYQASIKSGKTTKVVKVRRSQRKVFHIESLAAAGNKIAYTGDEGHYPHESVISRLVNLKTKKATSLPRAVIGISSAGVLLQKRATVSRGSDASPVYLRTFSGHDRKVLSSRTFQRRPEIAGHIIAWTDSAGILRMKEV